MNSQTRNACLGLLLVVPMILIIGTVAVFIAFDRGISFRPLLMFTATVLSGGLVWLIPLVSSRVGKQKEKVTFDERDLLIHKRAVMAGYVVLWLYLVAACVVPWCIVGPQGSVSVNILPLALLGGLIVFTLARGLATVVQYGRAGREVQS